MKKTACEKFICEFAHDFINENWDKVDKKRCEIIGPKDKFLKEVKSDFETAYWVLSEAMSWGMDKDYYRDMVVYESDDDGPFFRVLQFGDKYVKSVNDVGYNHTVSFVEPKTKTVIYFE